jgi:hypothetical protein
VLRFFLDPFTLKEESTVVFQDIINYYSCDTASNSMRLESSGTAVVYSEYLARHEHNLDKILSYQMLGDTVQCTIHCHVWKLLEMCCHGNAAIVNRDGARLWVRLC